MKAVVGVMAMHEDALELQVTLGSGADRGVWS